MKEVRCPLSRDIKPTGRVIDIFIQKIVCNSASYTAKCGDEKHGNTMYLIFVVSSL